MFGRKTSFMHQFEPHQATETSTNVGGTMSFAQQILLLLLLRLRLQLPQTKGARAGAGWAPAELVVKHSKQPEEGLGLVISKTHL